MALSLSFCNSTVSPQHQVKVNLKSKTGLQNVKNLVQTAGIPSIASSPQESLQNGNWVKLICGASFEDVTDIRNLSLVYTLAGVDCIDCAADASVVSAVNEGIEAAQEIVPLRRPWVMISVNDDEDLHFRKAEFDPEDCPLDCSRPCQIVCPANAISLDDRKPTSTSSKGTNTLGAFKAGVLTERCYGCGRCLPVCPYDKISAVTYIRDAIATAELIKRDGIDAIEIHTSGRQTSQFKQLWDGLGDSIRHLRLVAIEFVRNSKIAFCTIQVSLPDVGESTISSMKAMYSIMEPHLSCLNLWQLDGRPMSGDIGRGATRESIAFALRLASMEERPKGFLQLAGGTNAHTVDGLKKVGLFKTKGAATSLQWLIGGVAYGGYARKIVGRILSCMQTKHGLGDIDEYPDYLLEALREALALVGTVKCYNDLL
ncbi:uncharacterized protein LOC107418974 isoform X1 [Ziziphus jujuba]|uniref:Uncharacterized protein LOC107418974 isoform X1 n=1 Tax=Ziziphus jujuba TaxID=326968 RepID=A0A6P4ABX8_ZIZJJ|nr:uncharacterized protein LOC107418974 isoform X1 [Ziziphus jujuba]